MAEKHGGAAGDHMLASPQLELYQGFASIFTLQIAAHFCDLPTHT